MIDRITLQKTLENLLGTRNVYHQPPESMKLNYPCIIYSLGGIHNKSAANSIYITHKSYSLKYITKDPDDSFVDKLNDQPYCGFSNQYKSGDLYINVFKLYNNSLLGGQINV